MAEQKTYHVERYHWAFDFEKHPGGVYVTSTGPGIRKQPQDIQTADQALMYCCSHGLSVGDLDVVTRMVTGHGARLEEIA